MMEHAVLVILLVGFSLGAKACDVYSYHQCAKPFFSKYPPSEKDFIPDFKDTSLYEVCRDFDKLASCAAPVMEGCFEANQIVWAMWKSSKNALNYMCSSKQSLKTNAACIYGADLTKSFISCNQTMQNTVAAIAEDVSSASSSELCSAMTQFRTCTVSAANTYCGSDVSKWVGGFVDAALEPAKKAVMCMSATNMLLIFGVGGGVVVVIGIISGLVCLALQKRKNKKNPYATLNVAV